MWDQGLKLPGQLHPDARKELAELMNSAGALVVAITEPVEFVLSGRANGNDSLDIA